MAQVTATKHSAVLQVMLVYGAIRNHSKDKVDIFTHTYTHTKKNLTKFGVTLWNFVLAHV